MAPRQFDIVVFGATGFTGQLVCEYLARQYGVGGEVRWALAGRNREKLEAVKQRLTLIASDAARLPIIIADSGDIAALRELAAQTRVVCALAGPFARYGTDLVAACVEQGTHYCDITGEVQWVRRMIDQHHERARASGTRIVHCCGFDSIPSDLGLLVLQEYARARHGGPCVSVKSTVHARGMNASGGTIASILDLVEEVASDREAMRVFSEPLSLVPDEARTARSVAEARGVRYDAELKSFTAPFPTAVGNTRVIHRSNALLGLPYGRDFEYYEVAKTGSGPRGALRASAMAAGFEGLQAAKMMKPLLELVRKRVPQPGEGPSARARARAYFALQFYGRAADGTPVRARFAANGDAGYGETSKMVAESALCLAKDALTTPGGVLTPASAMGMPLVERLRRAGMRIDAWAADARTEYSRGAAVTAEMSL